MAKSISGEIITKIGELSNHGLSREAISYQLGLSTGTVYYYLHPEKRVVEYERGRRYAQMNLAKRRQTVLTITTNGKAHKVRVNKRPRPEVCELCSRVPKRLNWHHWDPDHLEWGLWLCYGCHIFVGKVESGLSIRKYEELKQWATNHAEGSIY